jgi:hypothetical protein
VSMWGIYFHDTDGDDRRGSSDLRYTVSDKGLADRWVEMRNGELYEQWKRRANETHRQAQHSVAEHNALVDAGLRPGPKREGPLGDKVLSRETWDANRWKDYYHVDEIEMEDDMVRRELEQRGLG